MTTENYIKIYSPATIANMGPGFDCIGGAIDIWNEFEFIFQPDECKTSELKIKISELIINIFLYHLAIYINF